MGRAVSKEMREEIHRILGESVNGPPGENIYLRGGDGGLRYSVVCYLEDIGAFHKLQEGVFRVTAQGREHWEKMNAPRKYWLRQNWFPASVATGTILFSAVATTANVINMVL